MEAVQMPDTTGSEEGPGVEAGTESIWDQNTMDKVSAFARTCNEVDTARAALNARKAAGLTELIDLGFNKDAVKAALKYAATPEDDRENFDLSYIYARKALGTPIQDDLFVAATQQQVKVATRKPTQE